MKCHRTHRQRRKCRKSLYIRCLWSYSRINRNGRKNFRLVCARSSPVFIPRRRNADLFFEVARKFVHVVVPRRIGNVRDRGGLTFEHIFCFVHLRGTDITDRRHSRDLPKDLAEPDRRIGRHGCQPGIPMK